MLCDTVKTAARARVRGPAQPLRFSEIPPKPTADAVTPRPAAGPMVRTTGKVVVPGPSTGGTQAIELGAADKILPRGGIAGAVMRSARDGEGLPGGSTAVPGRERGG